MLLRSVREEVAAEHHVLLWTDDGIAGRGFKQVRGGNHERTGFRLGLIGERNVHGHLITIEVRVEGGTDERMQLNRKPLNQHRLECLDAESVECWSTV